MFHSSLRRRPPPGTSRALADSPKPNRWLLTDGGRPRERGGPLRDRRGSEAADRSGTRRALAARAHSASTVLRGFPAARARCAAARRAEASRPAANATRHWQTAVQHARQVGGWQRLLLSKQTGKFDSTFPNRPILPCIFIFCIKIGEIDS